MENKKNNRSFIDLNDIVEDAFDIYQKDQYMYNKYLTYDLVKHFDYKYNKNIYGGDYHKKYLKYKHKYLALQNHV